MQPRLVETTHNCDRDEDGASLRRRLCEAAERALCAPEQLADLAAGAGRGRDHSDKVAGALLTMLVARVGAGGTAVDLRATRSSMQSVLSASDAELDALCLAVRLVSAEPLIGDIGMFPLLRGQPARIDWVIVGGESGPAARTCDAVWVRSIVRQCRAATVPCFVKQLGARYIDALNGIGGHQLAPVPEYGCIARLRDRKGGDPSEWPSELRTRGFPRCSARGDDLLETEATA
jgi:hypothetical protein